MRRALLVPVLALLPQALPAPVSATPLPEWYRATVTRIDQEVYRDSTSNVLIITQFCYEYAYSEDVVVKYEPYGFDNKLFFGDGETCDVKAIYRV